MTVEDNIKDSTSLNVEAGNRAADIVASTLGILGAASITETIVDFSKEIDTLTATGVGAFCLLGSATIFFANHRNRGVNHVNHS